MIVNGDSGNVNSDSGNNRKSVHVQPEQVFTMNRNRCSRSTRMSVHDQPDYAAEWKADPDWQAFQPLCYSDTETPDAAAIRRGVNHLVTAAQNGHAPAQCRLATELHLGEGRLGIKPDISKAAAWYRLAAKNGDPIALQSLVVLAVTHPDIMKQESDAY